MDEVDGISSGDKGGVSSIINLIKTTMVPIICICNDRMSKKIKSLREACLEIRFYPPSENDIAGLLFDIV